ncbi:YitT family protein [uncultured Veillonella sp.]|uniref:YitT family protein n=1 Tax=uncultured Veillonella sp. TaxID=159268 RepID=UPI0025EFE9DD|nr:YitT family protein [uncultured Veillonella sp.]
MTLRWTSEEWKIKIFSLIKVVLGTIMFSIGIDAFLVPHKLVSGGISGIALIQYYITGIPIGVMNLILNIPIVYAAYRWLGGWHVFMTVFGTAVSSYFIDQLHFLSAYNLSGDPVVGSILGGIFSGVGLGIVYRAGGNTGGLDPIALIIRKYYGMQIGSVLLSINMMILVVAAFIISVDSAAITMISSYISAFLTNKVIVGFSQRKAIFIVSRESDKICNLILHKIGRGATILNGEGAYTHQQKQVILVVVGLMQVSKLKEAIQREDPSAFLMISDVAEVIGQGFTFKSDKALVDKAREAREQADLVDAQAQALPTALALAESGQVDAGVHTVADVGARTMIHKMAGNRPTSPSRSARIRNRRNQTNR